MRRQCAWCEKDMGTVPGQPGTENDTTHAICPRCAGQYVRDRILLELDKLREERKNA